MSLIRRILFIEYPLEKGGSLVGKTKKEPFVDKIGLANLLNLDEIVAEDEARRSKKTDDKSDKHQDKK